MPVHATKDLWVLETDTTAYALGLDRDGRLVHYYWGIRLPRVEDYQNQSYPYEWASFNLPENMAREEYPAFAGARYIEPCFKAFFADGVRDVVLEFASAEVSADTQELVIH
ncbi:MAG: alpha-galactosidase, partial [Anaerolineaceae bacterium]|nr:alpha-galactosidase [Anaerolineaceae bacterium]